MSDFQGVNPVRWPVWLALPKVELWQAVALTLEIEPTDDLRRTDLIHGPHGGMSLRRLRGDFWGRLSVCKQGMGAKGPIRPQGPLYAGILQDSRCPVLLSEVVEFLSKAAFDIPDELQLTNASTTPSAPAASLAEPVPLSLDEAIAAAAAEHKAKKEWFAAAVAECEARDAKLSALSPDVANMARKLMGFPPRSNAPKPLTPVRGVSAPMATPPRTPAEAVPRPAALLAEPVRFEDLPRVMAEAMQAGILRPLLARPLALIDADTIAAWMTAEAPARPAVAAPAPTPAPSASALAVAVPAPVATPAEAVPVSGAGGDETPVQRRERLQQRVNHWKAQGVRDFTARAAAEEGVTEDRIRQILRKAKTKPATAKPKAKPRQPATPFSGLMPSADRTR